MLVNRGSLIAVVLLCAAPPAHAEFTANAGWQSQYIFRGVFQSKSSAQGGFDFEKSGFYLGTWAADVDQGAEVDLYGGYNHSFGDASLGIGATGYYYTDDFDDTYQEINLHAGYGPVSLDYAIGEYDNFDGPTLDYGFLAASFEWSGAFGTIGSFSQDFDGMYYELGYGFDVSGIDFTIAWVYSDKDLAGGESESNIVFGISKTFTIAE